MLSRFYKMDIDMNGIRYDFMKYRFDFPEVSFNVI